MTRDRESGLDKATDDAWSPTWEARAAHDWASVLRMRARRRGDSLGCRPLLDAYRMEQVPSLPRTPCGTVWRSGVVAVTTTDWKTARVPC